MGRFSPWPCHDCGEGVDAVSGECVGCGLLHREPQPGPQTEFIQSTAEIRIYAGPMGTGKTFALLLDWMVRGAAVDNAVGLICRQNANDVTIGGGLWDEAKKVFGADRPGSGVRMREGSSLDARWSATGSVLSFRHLKDGSVENKKGPGFSWIGIEEATQVSMASIIWLLQRMRSVHGIRPVMAMTTNPDPFHALRDWVDWYVLETDDGSAPLDPAKSGIVRYTMAHTTTGRRVFGSTPAEVAELAEGEPADAMSYTVIVATLDDNKILNEADPRYRSKFSQMSPSERAKNLGGDWNAKPETGGMLRRSRWGVVTEPLYPIVRAARGWDKAATRPSQSNPDPDFTAGVKWLWDERGNAYLAGLAACREEPAEVAKLQRSTATLDGPAVDQAFFVDPAAAGKFDALSTEQNLRASRRCGRVQSYPAGNKTDQKVINATPLSKALEQGRVYLLAGPWLDEPYRDAGEAPRTIGELLWSQVGVFVDADAKDDVVDAASVGFNHGDRGPVLAAPTATARETKHAAAEILRQRMGLRR